jgi:hypothetical protein
MALSDIPEFVTAAPGELIRAGDWNQTQRLVRNAIRIHHHTRAASAPANDASTTDAAQQIASGEIADGAVTTAQLADNAVAAAKLADGAVIAAKIGAASVGTTHIQNNAVTSAKLSFATVNAGSASIPAGSFVESAVQLAAPSTKTTVYFPVLAILNSTGAGNSEVDAQIIYRQGAGATSTDVYIRLTNSGSAAAGVIWQVLIFSN